MNKYELALVVSAKIEDDARTATVEKAKEYITRAGGTVTSFWSLAHRIMPVNKEKIVITRIYYTMFYADFQAFSLTLFEFFPRLCYSGF